MTAYLNLSEPSLNQVSTLVDILRQRAQNSPNQLAYTFLQNGQTQTATLTYQELDSKARAIAATLQSLGYSGGRALLLYPPSLEFVAAFFGCLYASMIAIPAYPPRRNQSMLRLEAIIENAQTTVALTTTSVIDNIQGLLSQNPKLADMQLLTTDNIASPVAELWQQPNLSGNTLAFLQYTSGSTGTPKGVMVSHDNLLHNSKLIHQSFGHTPNSHGVIWLPPYHDMGLIGGVIQPLYGGFPVTLMSPVDFLKKPLRWLEAISQYQGTTSGGPNFAYELCINKVTPEQIANLDLSSWEVAFTGAEPVRSSTIDLFAETFKSCGFRRQAFYPCYGMAETTLIVTGGLKKDPPVVQQVEGAALEQNRVLITHRKENARTIVGCGQSLSEQKVVIVDPETLTQCPADRIGEIWVSGASVACGYWNRLEETKATFKAYLADTAEGPFLRTGDLGFLLNGELFITGRLKDMIIIRGQNHYPHDIELTVEKSHPAVRIGCGAAFGIDANGSEHLVIVQEIERNYLHQLDVNEVIGNICQAVAAEHDLQVYAVVLVKTGSIPKTSSGKIQRYACRARFLSGSLNVIEDWSQNPRHKVKFLHLQTEVGSILQQVQLASTQEG
ncbi:fatty acyl-AMP ligase [Desmonostoc muscorum LEGE 12446]|uniref:Fatty acyl-AMP ligase n=1 Tax=Desmonostoc muscorum LEGE 12446 TaxID=1828758 RepID=A0A8J7CWE6_DESMC|nr:fatty acyl-AMP ligase [Desmonostoc muscorum]MCF2144951.1 fatty acyl-AMP ligase [Desmonostoc muscorum LEGE 12446]